MQTENVSEIVEEVIGSTIFENSVITVGISIICLLFAVIGVILIALLHRMFKRAGLNNDEIMLSHIKLLVMQVVGEANQLVVDKLKASHADGKLTDDEASKIFESVKMKIISFLSGAESRYLEERYNEIDSGLEILIEDAVRYLKAPKKD